MSDTVLTLTQLEDVFYNLVSIVYPSTSTDPVRVGWIEDGQPAWGITDDICFLLVNYEDAPVSYQAESTYDNGTLTQTRITPVRVQFEVYGPNAFDYALLVRDSLTFPSVKNTLAASNLSLIPTVPVPTRAPELYNAQWWPHASFYATFYQLVKREQSVDYIATANVTTEVDL